MLPRPKMRSQIMHIPTGLFLEYCYWPRPGEIHLTLSKNPSLSRNNLELFEQVSDPSWDIYTIHNGDDVFEGTCEEFVLVEQRV